MPPGALRAISAHALWDKAEVARQFVNKEAPKAINAIGYIASSGGIGTRRSQKNDDRCWFENPCSISLGTLHPKSSDLNRSIHSQ